MTDPTRSSTSEPMYWIDATIGTLGVPRSLVPSSDVRVLDLYRFNWFTPAIKIEGREPSPASLPFVALTICDDAVTYLMSTLDARKIAASLDRVARDGERYMSRETRLLIQRHERELQAEAARQAREGSLCAVNGCKRARRFFDDDGRGFCPRHADELGIRPKGKL